MVSNHRPNAYEAIALPSKLHHHIETHYPRLTTLARALLKSNTVRNVFLYGRGARERSEFYWLKASYFTLKFHPLIGFVFVLVVEPCCSCDAHLLCGTVHDERSSYVRARSVYVSYSFLLKLVGPERIKLPLPGS